MWPPHIPGFLYGLAAIGAVVSLGIVLALLYVYTIATDLRATKTEQRIAAALVLVFVLVSIALARDDLRERKFDHDLADCLHNVSLVESRPAFLWDCLP